MDVVMRIAYVNFLKGVKDFLFKFQNKQQDPIKNFKIVKSSNIFLISTLF